MAVKLCRVLTCTDTLAGNTDTVIAGPEVMVMVQLDFFVLSVTEVAVSLTVAGLGALAGAV